MKILFLSTQPPTVCGVGDYTVRLAEALQRQGMEATIEAHSAWKTKVLGQVLQKIAQSDVVHLQYPTVDFKTSLVPLLALTLSHTPTVLTLHEYSQSHPLRRMFVQWLCRTAKCVVFVENQERQHLNTRISSLKTKSVVIPIASNIPKGTPRPKAPRSLVHFGLIRPERGLEEFLKVAGMLPNWDIQVIGQVQQGQESYFSQIKQLPEAQNVKWTLGLSPEAVAEQLAGIQFAYLPFPDGASPRRGSLLACLLNGVHCITTRGQNTPIDFQHCMDFTDNPQQTATRLQALAMQPQQAFTNSRDHPQNWDEIATMHIYEYQRLLSSHPSKVKP